MLSYQFECAESRGNTRFSWKRKNDAHTPPLKLEKCITENVQASAKVAKIFGRHRESNPGMRACQFLGLRALSRAFFDPGKKLKSLDLPRVRVT